MHQRLLDFLECSKCKGEFRVEASLEEGGHVMEGQLHCKTCGETVPVIGGVPRFVGAAAFGGQKKTAEHFGYQWNTFDEVESPQWETQFADWLQPLRPEDLSGKIVLDGGCGKGRHSYILLKHGVKEIVGVDISHAVDAAFANLKSFSNAHIIQADILRLPLKPACFDHVYSIGVVHHTPDPEGALLRLAQTVRPGGSLGAMVYGRENNGWVVNIVTPLRLAAVKLLSPGAIKFMAWFCTALLYPVLKLVYRPLNLRFPKLAAHLFYNAYFFYIAPFTFREIYLIVYDHVNAPIAHYISKEDFTEWFRKAGFTGLQLIWRNQNTWQGHATRPGTTPSPSR